MLPCLKWFIPIVIHIHYSYFPRPEFMKHTALVMSTTDRNKSERCAVGDLTIKLSVYYLLIKKFVPSHKHFGSV